MMNIQTQTTEIAIPKENLLAFLKDPKNYEELMPNNTTFTLISPGEGFFFQPHGMPRVGLKLKPCNKEDSICFESPTEQFSYKMKIICEALTQNSSKAHIFFEGNFNPLITMMVKKPLTNFLSELTQNIKNAHK